MRVRVKAQHGQFYSLVYGPLPLRGRPRRFWRPNVVGLGATPGEALIDAGRLVEALEKAA